MEYLAYAVRLGLHTSLCLCCALSFVYLLAIANTSAEWPLFDRVYWGSSVFSGYGFQWIVYGFTIPVLAMRYVSSRLLADHRVSSSPTLTHSILLALCFLSRAETAWSHPIGCKWHASHVYSWLLCVSYCIYWWSPLIKLQRHPCCHYLPLADLPGWRTIDIEQWDHHYNCSSGSINCPVLRWCGNSSSLACRRWYWATGNPLLFCKS